MLETVPAVPSVLPPRPAFNYVRAIAVWLVIIGHWTLASIPIGEVGRLTFFVLSGYLISGIVWKYKVYIGVSHRRVGVFYARRALRILPPYFVALGLGMLLPLATLREYPGWFILPASNLLFYRLQHWGEGVGHYWTLAVDEQFYLLWPLLLTFTGRRIAPLLLIAATGLLFRIGWSIWVKSGFMLVLLPASLDLFAIGALLHHTEHWPSVQRFARLRWVVLAWGSWAAGWIFTHLILDAESTWILIYPLWGAGAAFITLAWVQRSPGLTAKHGLLSIVEWVGRRSYGCYLYHLMLPVFYQRVVYYLLPATIPNAAALRHFWLAPLPTVLILTPILLSMAAASWSWLEAPLERVKSSLSYKIQPS